jgi:hypothetical protein
MPKPFAFITLSAVLILAATSGAEGERPKPNPLIVKAYPVGDLPVWRVQNGQPVFDPQILMLYLKTNVLPNSWRKNLAEMSPFEKNASLVVSQIEEGHAEIAEVIASLREKDNREAPERFK